ncbi:MAG: hypothetical protein NZ560_02540 [Aquificaceae bacterium]|nr:hypothetical protein [Aquificaceae bacterium]MDW8096656.1 hypothetical protein [Aquificaceae bacterium]
MFRGILLQDWQYKLLSLFVGTALWLALGFGERVTVSLERTIELVNREPDYTYKLERTRVKARLRVVERLVSQDALEEATAYVDVGGLKEGEYLLKVRVRDLPRFLVSVEKIEPPQVRVKVMKAPQRGQ